MVQFAHMKKYLLKIISLVICIEGVYLLVYLINFIHLYYEPAPQFIIASIILLAGALCLIASGIGLFKNKNWSITMSWVLILLPTFMSVIYGFFLIQIPLLGHPDILFLNSIIVIFLTLQWKRLPNHRS
jgi:hypothetical protein